MPDAKVIEPGHNTWFSGGNNLGAAQASSEYVFILNPDTIIQPNTLTLMLDYLRAHPSVGAVTCQLRGLDHTLQFTCSRVPRYGDLLLTYTFLGLLLSPLRDHYTARMWYTGWQRDITKAIEVAPGSCIIARRTLYERIGGFDETLKLYYTEDDLCKRMLATGCEIHFVADVLLLHEEHVSTRHMQSAARHIYFDDMLIFCSKHYGALPALMLRLLTMPTLWLMELKQRQASRKQKISV